MKQTRKNCTGCQIIQECGAGDSMSIWVGNYVESKLLVIDDGSDYMKQDTGKTN